MSQLPTNIFSESLKDLKKNLSIISEEMILSTLMLCISVDLIVQDDLENLYLALRALRTDIPYNTYIALCQKINYSSETKLQKHHIIPRHAGGTDEPSNLILISIPLHAIAHWLLWRLFNRDYDKLAYTLMTSVDADKNSVAAQQLQARYKEENRQFYNSEFQQRMGQKGGKKGGAANTTTQFLARSKVGLMYGQVMGIANQSPELVEFLSKYSIWHLVGYFDENNNFCTYGRKQPDKRQKHLFFIISPKKSFVELAGVLQMLFPTYGLDATKYKQLVELVPKQKASSSTRNTRYGFTLYTTLTRSEALEGDIININSIVKQILREFPNAEVFDEID